MKLQRHFLILFFCLNFLALIIASPAARAEDKELKQVIQDLNGISLGIAQEVLSQRAQAEASSMTGLQLEQAIARQRTLSSRLARQARNFRNLFAPSAHIERVVAERRQSDLDHMTNWGLEYGRKFGRVSRWVQSINQGAQILASRTISEQQQKDFLWYARDVDTWRYLFSANATVGDIETYLDKTAALFEEYRTEPKEIVDEIFRSGLRTNSKILLLFYAPSVIISLGAHPIELSRWLLTLVLPAGLYLSDFHSRHFGNKKADALAVHYASLIRTHRSLWLEGVRRGYYEVTGTELPEDETIVTIDGKAAEAVQSVDCALALVDLSRT